VTARLHDLRDQAAFAHCLAPEEFSQSQRLARDLRANVSDGFVYPSVPEAGGECIAAFSPDVVAIPV
ncbi:unnamed protein product, partial [Scytosiphon promiscuus]